MTKSQPIKDNDEHVAKFLSKILTSQIQDHIKNTTHYDQIGLVSEMVQNT